MLILLHISPDEKSSLSYRNSIKNKYRTSALQAAKIQSKTALEKSTTPADSVAEKLAKLNLEPPKLVVPSLKSNELHEVEKMKQNQCLHPQLNLKFLRMSELIHHLVFF